MSRLWASRAESNPLTQAHSLCRWSAVGVEVDDLRADLDGSVVLRLRVSDGQRK